MTYYPGNVSIRMADLAVINKVETATPDGVNQVRENVRDLNEDAGIIEAASPITVEDPQSSRTKKF